MKVAIGTSARSGKMRVVLRRAALFLIVAILGFSLFEPGMNRALALSNANKEFKLDYDLKPLKSEGQNAAPDLTQEGEPVAPDSLIPKIDNPRGHNHEDVSKRTAFSSTYVNNDGTKTLQTSTRQQNYKNGDKWEKIDNRLTPVEDLTFSANSLQGVPPLTPKVQPPAAYKAKAGLLNIGMNPLAQGLHLSVGGKNFVIQPVGAQNSKPEKKNDTTVVYKDAWDGVDLEYEVRGELLKENIIVKRKDAAKDYEFKISGAKIIDDPANPGLYTIEGLGGDYRFGALTLSLNDKGMIQEKPLTQRKTSNNSIVVSVDPQWFASQPTSAFPLTIDPSFGKWDADYTDWMFKSDGYSCQGNRCWLQAGTLYDYGWKHWRTYVQLPYGELSGKRILGANIHAYYNPNANPDPNQRYLFFGHANCIGWECRGTHLATVLTAGDFDVNVTNHLQERVNVGDMGVVWSLWGEEVPYKTFKTYSNMSLSVVYDTPTPESNRLSPANGQVVVDAQPTLKGSTVTDADGAAQYYFRVSTNSDPNSGAVINSGWIYTPQWTIPDGILQDGTTYYWKIFTRDDTQTGTNTEGSVGSFKVDFRNSKDTTQTYDTVGPVGVNLATGSASVENGSHTMSALGGPLGVSLSYDTPNRAKKGLKAEYWNVSTSQNTAIGAPTSAPNAIRVDPNINFDWSTASPDPRIGADHFYTRWTGKMIVPTTGEYTFGASIDDDYAVYINGNKVASSGCCFGPATYANSIPVTLQAGQIADVRVEYHEYVGLAYMKLFVKGAVPEQEVPRDWFYTDDPNGSNLYGLMGRYYTDNANAHDLDEAAKDPMRLMFARQDTKMNLDFGSGGPAASMQADNFMARWTGYLTVPSGGDYQIGAYTDDGLRIKLNNGFLGAQTTPIDAWRDQATTIWSGNTHIDGNVAVPITIDWYEHGGGAALKLYIRGNGFAEQEIPVSWLSPKANALPDGWQLNLDVDGNVAYERLRLSGSSVILEDSSRQAHEYTSTGSGYKPPLNEDGVLVKNGDNTYTLTDVDGRVYIFDAEGKLKSVTTPADDRQPAALKYEYGNDPSRLLRIVDGVNSARYATLHYKGIQEDNLCGHPSGFDDVPNGMLCALRTSDGDVTHFYYQNGQLARIEKPGNDLTDYRYNTKGQIDTIRDGLAADAIAANVRADDESVTTQLVYDSLGRVRAVKAPAATANSSRLEHTVVYKGADALPFNRFISLTNSDHRAHVISTLPGYRLEFTQGYIATEQTSGTIPLYSCMVGGTDEMVSVDSKCEGQVILGRLGYAYDGTKPQPANTTPIYRCNGGEHFVSTRSDCEGQTVEYLLGYISSQQSMTGATEMHITDAPEPTGFSKRIAYDALLRTVSETDLTGKTTMTEWNSVKDLQFSSTDATGLKSTTIYDNDDRPIDSYGPAPAAWYDTDRKPLAAYANQIPHTSTGYDEGINGPATTYMAIKQRNSSVLPTNASLLRGQSVASPDERFTFTYQTDGNVVLYGPNGAIWSNGKANVASDKLVMQGDGNLVLYNGGTAVWASNTGGGNNPYLKVQNDGNAIIYNSAGGSTWSTGTGGQSYTVDNPTSLIGTPLLNKTNLTENSTQVSANWSASPVPSGSDYWGVRMTGKLRLPTTGNWTFRIVSDNGVRMSINDSVVINDWNDGATRSHPTYVFNNTGTGSSPRLSIDYYHLGGSSANFTLYMTPPGQAETSDVVQYISPSYNLSTSTTAYDSQLGNITSTTQYKNPAYGQIASTTLDPSGLNYQSKAEYEAPGQGFLRQTSKTLPGGGTTSYQHYSAEDIRDNPCTPEVEAFHQAGRPKSKTEADPDGDGPQQPRTSETIYNESGDVVATRYNSDPWTCMSYDARGRVTQTIVPALGVREGRTITNNYAVDGNPLITATTDNAGTVTVETDLLGRMVKYTDARGNTTNSTYDTHGKLISRTSPLGIETYEYDQYDRLIVQKLDSVTYAAVTYDQFSRIASVTYPAGLSLSSIGRDSLGRENSNTFTLASGQSVTDSITRAVSGDVISGTENGVTKNYTYDKAGRLTGATIGSNTFSYEFGASDTACGTVPGNNPNAAKNGNRTKLTINGQATTYCYDMADRLIASSDSHFSVVEYDDHGNTIRLGADGQKTEFGYDASDRNTLVKETSSDTTKQVYYQRDAQSRLTRREVKTNGAVTDDSYYGYTASGDSPDFLTNAAGAVTQKYVTLPGDVLVTIKSQNTSAGAATFSLPNIHGDVFATVDADGSLISTHMTGPFGESLPNRTSPTNTADGASWNYVGQHQKTTESELAIQPVQMGARVYIPILGRFLSVDSVEGGTDNSYVYANDPVNEYDLDGKAINWKSVIKWGTRAAVAASFVPGPIGMVASVVAATGYVAQGKYGQAGLALVGFIPGGRLAATVASKSSLGVKLLTKTMNFQAKARGIGVNSRVFGYAAHGSKSFGNKTLSKLTSGYLRAGWAQGIKKGSVAWRVGSRQYKPVFVMTSYKLKYFRGG